MVAPATQNVFSPQTPQRRRKGTIASRYLEAIGIQCGADSNVGMSSTNTVRSTHNNNNNNNNNNFDNQYFSFNDRIKKKNNAYGAAIASECSKSIITASTAVMMDDSFSTTTASCPGGSGIGKIQRSSPRRTIRRGRSPTANRIGTNSKNNVDRRSRSDGNRTINERSTPTNNRDDCNQGCSQDCSQEYVFPPGSRSQAPLVDGVASAPSTPTRFNQRRKQLLEGQHTRNKSWSNGAFSSNIGESRSPITPLTAKSIMGLDSSHSDSEYSNGDSSHPDSRLGLNRPPDLTNAAAANNTGRGLFPKTNPRMPSDSPGPQPRSPRQHEDPYAQHQEQGYSRSLFDQMPKIADPEQYQHQREDNLSSRSHNNSQPHSTVEAVEDVQPPSRYASEPTDSEAGAPTEIIKNHRSLHVRSHLRRPSAGASEPTSPPSNFRKVPTDSEAGAPTEITKNHRIVRSRPYHLRRPSDGDGGNQVSLKERRPSSSNSGNMDILSRVRSRFHNQRQEHEQPQNDPVKASMPSLLDANSSSVSSALPIAAAQAEGAPASILSPSPASRTPSRLSRHVENARKQSLWSPSASETTATPASENNGISSLTTEMGAPLDRKIGAQPLSSLFSAKASTNKPEPENTVPKVGGLKRRPVGARVAALEAQYRRGKFTVRGARTHQQDEAKERQQIGSEEAKSVDDGDRPDPILSISHTMSDNERESKVKDDKADTKEEHDRDEEDSHEALGKKSFDTQDYEIYDDDESTLPGLIRNQNDEESSTAEAKDCSEEFIAYNDRQTPNTDGVFQLQSNSKGTGNSKKKDEEKTRKKTESAEKKARKSRSRDRSGKSPIQPLFSSERLDENNKASIQESSIRSRSLGRPVSSNPLMKNSKIYSYHSTNSSSGKDGDNINGLPRRSKSLSERPERNHQYDHQRLLSTEHSEAVRTTAMDRQRRTKSSSKHGAPQKPVPGNIVVKNEMSKTEDGAETSKSGSSLTRSSTRSSPPQASKKIDSNAKSPRNREASVKEPTTSIKDKIRAYNLKKSRSGSAIGILPHERTSVDRKPPDSIQNSVSHSRGNSRAGTKRSSSKGEEKKQDAHENNNYSFKSMRDNLERKSPSARHFVESSDNHDNDESSSGAIDDYSFHSLRDQLEQKVHESHKDDPFGDDDDDDDRSVRSLREMFEPPKQSGEAISHLKARFEPKPKAPRLSLKKSTKSSREKRKTFFDSPGEGSRESEIPDVIENKAQSYEWWKLKDKDPQQVDANHNAEISSSIKTAKYPLNKWSERRQTERKSIVLDQAERTLNSSESNPSIEGKSSSIAKSQRLSIDSSMGKHHVPTQQKVFGAIETRHSPLKDNSRMVPGSHWTSQGSRGDREHQLKKKGTKESSSDSEYSDAVTLDPSFAEVSNLSNPSALQSPDTERNSEASSSVLFENLESKAPSGDSDGKPGATNPELALPELKEPRREKVNRNTISSSSKAAYRNNTNFESPTQSSKTVTESNRMHLLEDHPRVVTPDGRYDLEVRENFFSKFESVDPSGHVYATSNNDQISDSIGVVSPMQVSLHQSPHDLTNQGFQVTNESSRTMHSSYRVAEPTKHFSQTSDTPYEKTEASSRSVENFPWIADSSNRPRKSSDTRLQAFEPSYRSTQSGENGFKDFESLNGFGEPTDASEHFFESSYRSNRSSRSSESPREVVERTSDRSSRSMGNPHREVESPNRSTRSSDTSKSRHSNYQQKPKSLDPEVPEDYGPSRDESRGQKVVARHNLLAGTSRPGSELSAVPPMPSPFDENYAAIMESRHKMLMMRQRALLNRRASREKLQNSQQQGFFGRTNPGKINANRTPSNRNYRDTGSSARIKEFGDAQTSNTRIDDNPSDEFEVLGRTNPGKINAKRSPSNRKYRDTGSSAEVRGFGRVQTSNTRITDNPSDEFEVPKIERKIRPPSGSDHGLRQAKEKNEARVPQSPVASMFSRIRPAFGMSAGREKRTSQKQAVIDRISAVRAARMRRYHAYGQTNSNKNFEPSHARRLDNDFPRKTESIDDSISYPVPGYRYYPHTDSKDSRSRDDDQSLSTRESNPQDYAADLSLE